MALDNWYRSLHLKISIEQFHQLPRSSAFKYEYINGEAWLTPRPKTYNALLELTPRAIADTVEIQNDIVAIRPLDAGDWKPLTKLFVGSFRQVPPFVGLDDDDRLKASSECLHQTRTGGDGPLLDRACFIAETTNDERRLVGAILMTLIPKKESGQWWDGDWYDPPTTDAARRLLGRPHLTWIFVAPFDARNGLGTALLDHAVNALIHDGYTDLASTFLLGNDSTMLWHWRNGFRLLAYPGSMRTIMKTVRANLQSPNPAM